MNEWNLDIDRWPDPDRKKWRGLRDLIQESPDGRYAAVLYSCGEVGIGKEVGLFALLKGPKDAPRLLLRPRGLACLALYDPGKSMQWIENRYCVVTPYSTKPCFSGKFITYYGTMVFDMKERRVSYIPDVSPDKVMPNVSDGLSWKSWRRLSWWPRLWHKK
jgi:hypothetical protein